MLKKIGKVGFVMIAYPFAFLLSIFFDPNGGPVLLLRDILKDQNRFNQ
ncbi:hypothetical protein ACFSO7_13730 [Bacillus sp. CGMCC 1.16607]